MSTSSLAPKMWFTPFDLMRRATNPLSTSMVQVALVVPDVEATCERLQQLYGIPGFQFLEHPPASDVIYQGEPIDVRVKLALGFMDDLNFEIIQPLAGGDANIYSDFLATNPNGGLHHIGFRVLESDAAAAHLEEVAGPAVQTGKLGTDGGHFAYFDTRATMGVFTELIFMDPLAEIVAAHLRAGDVEAFRAEP